MKQIVQNPRSGEVSLVDVPVPLPEAGTVLVRNHFSLVSPGTETQALQFGQLSALGKARSRPDLVAQVARKLRDEGPLATYRAVLGRLDALQPLGYSSAGVVEALGPGVADVRVGDRVACAGAGRANHAELVVVPENLVARVPEGVALEHAAFATLGAIALQGLRVAGPTLGEVAAVVGLGLVGQLALQLLRANGCRVLALDLDAERVKLAQQQGADWAFRTGELPATWAVEATDGHGADLVLVAASASGAEPLELAARLCRHKGRIALVGNVPVQADRRLLYEKELELRMSTSYGPGRYDRSYEEHGLDYPIGYVRWTEQRNLQAFLQLVASGAVRPGSLAPEIVPFAEARQVYVDLGRGERRPLALVFRYDAEAPVERVLPAGRARPRVGARGVGVAFLGAGNYARGVLLPALGRVAGVRAEVLVASSGASARRSAERFGFARCGTDPELVLRDPEVDLVFVVTRHDSHAELARRALEAGKAVWLEKPAGIAPDEVEALVETAARTGGFLALGYNRRFSPHTRAIRDAFVGRVGPLALHYGVAAGPPPAGHWIADPRVGGGRIVGEVCHFVDLCSHLVGAPPATVYARALGRDAERDDSVVAVLGFGDGSTATLEYLAFAGEELPKERLEASGDRRTALCDNFRTTRISGARGVRGLRQDKGQAAALAEVLRAVREGAPSPFRLDEIAAVSRTTFAMLESVATGRVVALGS